MSADDCAKVLKKDQCEKKGEKCMMTCGMCPEGEDMYTHLI